MSYTYCPYILDTETTSLDLLSGEIIELSIYRLPTDEQKTWFIKPNNIEAISSESLKINGHKYEDITWKTPHGRNTYKEQKEVIIDIENWLMEDNLPSEKRIFVAFNVGFDYPRLQLLWSRNDSGDSFPFGRRSVDPMSIAFFQDWATNNLSDAYSLSSLLKKYKIKNEKAHSAEADTKATAELFKNQISEFINYSTKGNTELVKQAEKNVKIKEFIKSLHISDLNEDNLLKLKSLIK